MWWITILTVLLRLLVQRAYAAGCNATDKVIVSAGDRATFDPKENRNTEHWPLDGQVSSGERATEGLYIA